ncbi:MAG: hypothetical protein ACXWC7_11770 [Chitinophagaceae bacterium]
MKAGAFCDITKRKHVSEPDNDSDIVGSMPQTGVSSILQTRASKHERRLVAEKLLPIEIKQINTSRLETVRHIFVFSCYTGFAYMHVCSKSYFEILKRVLTGSNG